MSQGGQLAFEFRTRGGRRAGAGRPRKKGAGASHLRRPSHSRHHPVHVTWRLRSGLPGLRRRRPFRAIRRSIVAAADLHGTRIAHFSVQSNHVHLIVEAEGRAELLRALRALGVRLARAVNRVFGRRGRVLSDRYHARALRTPLEVKRAIRYVLSNWKHHGSPGDVCRAAGVLDGYSSAAAFRGWLGGDGTERFLVVPRAGPDFAEALARLALPRTWLLREGWKRHGEIDADEVPGGR